MRKENTAENQDVVEQEMAISRNACENAHNRGETNFFRMHYIRARFIWY